MDLPRLPCGSLGLAKERLPNAKITLEIFIDLACPFSKRAFDRLVDEVAPHYSAASQSIQFVYHLTPQPWHPQVALIILLFIKDVRPQHLSHRVVSWRKRW